MKKSYLIALLCILVHGIAMRSQNLSFENILCPSENSNLLPFNVKASTYGFVELADIDNDNDLDLLISGDTNVSNNYDFNASLYINDGKGNFTLKTDTSFLAVTECGAQFCDFDNDNDQDVIIRGTGPTYDTFSTKYYKNDGNGNFAEFCELAPPPSYNMCYVKSLDVDNDNDQDVLLISDDPTQSKPSLLYLNDGSGNFTLDENNYFRSANLSSFDFGDIDNDNDLDLLFQSTIYINDGLGNFSKKTNNTLISLWEPSAGFVDIDNDGDLDILMTGQYSGEATSKLYINDGSGNFALYETSPFTGVWVGAIAFSDVNNDGLTDVFITGSSRGQYFDPLVARLYINKGNYSFNEIQEPFKGILDGDLKFADVDNDNDDDLIMTGQIIKSTYGLLGAILYLNDGNGNFSIASDNTFNIELYNCKQQYKETDTNKDSYIDFVEVGQKIRVLENDKNGTFSEKSSIDIGDWSSQFVDFADIDNDEDLDILVAGYERESKDRLRVYKNNGSFEFEVNSILFSELKSILDAKLLDANKDGYSDIIVSGYDLQYHNCTLLYINDKTDNFILSDNSFTGFSQGSIIIYDVDGDEDSDLLLTGRNNTAGIDESELYLNDGTGSFKKVETSSIAELNYSTAAFGDVDNDSDYDLVISGINSQNDTITMLYLNDGSCNYTENTDCIIKGVAKGCVSFSDVNNDNYIDLMLAGADSNGNAITYLYLNDETGNFVKQSEFSFIGTKDPQIIFTDMDNDKDQDILISGKDNQNKNTVHLYRNLLNTLTTSAEEINTNITSVYPNPTTGMINIKIKNNITSYILNIRRCNSQLITSKVVTSQNTQEFINGPQGLYLVELIYDNKKETYKIIKL